MVGSVGEKKAGSVNLSQLESIPDDIFNNVVCRLDTSSLFALEASQALRHRVQAVGIPTYLLHHPLPHLTTSTPPRQWPPTSLLRYNHRISHQIARRRWHAVQVGAQWPSPVIPVLEVTSDSVLLGVGGKLITHALSPRYREGARTIEKERIWNVAKRADGSRGDIVGIAPLADGQVVVAQFDGTVQRLDINGRGGVPRSTAHYSAPTKDGKGKSKGAIHTLAHDGDVFMTTTASPNPQAHIYSARSPWTTPISISLPTSEPRAWSSLVSTSSGYLPPSIMLGLSSSISIYDLPTLSTTTSSSGPSRRLTGPDLPARSSAYDIQLPPAQSVHHPSTLLSAWYDSHLRLHDLRSPSSSAIAEFTDPWTWAEGSGMYSATFFGEYGIAGGRARHGTVCLFDIRYPKKGWSVFSPGGKGSPVYSVKGEGGRIWGVTEKRAFVLAFDGSGEVEDGILSEQLMHEYRRDRAAKSQPEPRWNNSRGGTRRGGRMGWSTRSVEDEDDGSGRGYEHAHKGVELFSGLPFV